MAQARKERLIENLAIASALGFLALVVATLSLALDGSVAERERDALAPGGGLALAGRADDPCFDRFYSAQSEAGPSYAAVITLRSTGGAALMAARFSAKGELRELRLLGSCSSRLPSDPTGLLAEFPGGAEAIARAAAFARRIAAAAGERT